jgi:hypothetical protein
MVAEQGTREPVALARSLALSGSLERQLVDIDGLGGGEQRLCHESHRGVAVDRRTRRADLAGFTKLPQAIRTPLRLAPLPSR